MAWLETTCTRVTIGPYGEICRIPDLGTGPMMGRSADCSEVTVSEQHFFGSPSLPTHPFDMLVVRKASKSVSVSLSTHLWACFILTL